ncbi:MAG TPA: hypothetical protein VMR52_06230 [Dehalococcoidia bacterium]|nr:hypothetical protein [Dehalococcoidia bacterium]
MLAKYGRQWPSRCPLPARPVARERIDHHTVGRFHKQVREAIHVRW